MAFEGLNRCGCGRPVTPTSDRRRIRCFGCDNVFDLHWRSVGPSQVAKPGSLKIGPRRGPFVEHAVGWKYPLEDQERIRWGFVPRRMEDRWAMVVEDEQLFICRSWTGQLCYVAHLSPDGIARLEVSSDHQGQFGDPSYVRTLIDGILVGEGPGVR